MKAEKIDLQGSSSDSGDGDNVGQYAAAGEYGANPEDQFRTGPLDYTL